MMAERNMAAETEVQVAPEVLEFGRYRVFETPDGGWLLARARGTCETCQGCGCGEQADPIQVPAMFVAMAKSGGGLGALKARIKGAVSRG
jgi:hypothetical protein